MPSHACNYSPKASSDQKQTFGDRGDRKFVALEKDVSLSKVNVSE